MTDLKIDIGKIAETEVARNTANWIYRVIGAPIEEGVGLLFADALKEKRLRNAIRLKNETNRVLIENQRAIPLSFGYKLLDKATLEEDDVLIVRWATLLANSIDADYEGEIRKIFIDILDSLEPIDAITLEKISESKSEIDPFKLFEKEKWKELAVSINTLESLNLIRESYEEESVATPRLDIEDSDTKYVRGTNNGKYYITDLGKSFLNSVSRKIN